MPAQNGTGAILNSQKYAEVPLASPYTAKSYQQLPFEVSLKPYCPTPGNQFDTGTCVGWAAAYGARTIIEAMANGWESEHYQKLINVNAFSPSFLYNAVLADEGRDSDCMLGAHIGDALSLMREVGSVKFNDFPFDDSCEKDITTDQKIAAANNKISDFYRLSFVNGGDNAKVNRVRQSLNSHHPVILGMKILDNFKELKHEDNTWNPALGNPAKSNIHAMLVVGYDDIEQRFELMNSWGSDWGNGGFIYVSYKDFNKYAKEAYAVVSELPNRPKNLVNIAGEVEFRELAMERSEGVLNCTAEDIGSMNVEGSDNLYQMLRPTYSGSGFQIYLNPAMQNMSVYVFSVDQKNNVDLLYPFNNEILSLYGNDYLLASVTPYIAGTIAIPHEDYCLQLDGDVGTHYCFLFTKQPLEIDILIDKFKNTKGDLEKRLQKVLANKMVANNRVDFDPRKISFEANIASNEVIPIVVNMNHFK